MTTATRFSEICLYGTNQTGAGYLARAANGRRFGTGRPSNFLTFTVAIWTAVDELRGAGVTGPVHIYAPGGARMAIADLGRHVPTFGSLTWTPAPVYTLSTAALEAAAQNGGAQ